MFCICGDGACLPPMTVLKSLSGNFYDTWAIGGPPGSVFTANKSGWFNMREFEIFFEKVFLKYIQDRIPKEEVKVLIGDNLGSHLSPAVMQLCREHNIRLVQNTVIVYCTNIPYLRYLHYHCYLVPVLAVPRQELGSYLELNFDTYNKNSWLEICVRSLSSTPSKIFQLLQVPVSPFKLDSFDPAPGRRRVRPNEETVAGCPEPVQGLVCGK
jgi:hypothetical protein